MPKSNLKKKKEHTINSAWAMEGPATQQTDCIECVLHTEDLSVNVSILYICISICLIYCMCVCMSTCLCVCGTVTLFDEKRLSLGVDLEKDSAHSMGMLSL